MKARNILTAVKEISIISLIALIITSSLKAQNFQTEDAGINNAAKANIVEGIESPNLGFKQDCIYFSATYGIKEALDALKDQLKDEEDPSTCVLISLAIFKLSEQEDSNMLQGEALRDWNSKVGQIAGKIVEQYENSKSDIAAKNK
jgi:hypothetical protein